MKKKIISFLMIISAFFFIGNVNALEISNDDIPAGSYVIGTHLFTREITDTYDGTLTVQRIMLAAQTIGSDDISNMAIYYKNGSGVWKNTLTKETVNISETLKINYTNLQLEDDNDTVQAPQKPIVYIQAPTYIEDKSNTAGYTVTKFGVTLNIFVDDIANLTNKVDGLEISLENTSDSDGIHERIDIKYEDFFNHTVTVTEDFEEKVDGLIKGQTYHLKQIFFETEGGYTNINVRAYILDANGKKIYSDTFVDAIGIDDLFPYVKIVNKYTNPEYFYIDGDDYYTYKLGIELPDMYATNLDPNRFSYIVSGTGLSSNDVHKINEEFTVSIKKGTVATISAKLGYYDANGIFKIYMVEKKHEFIIDTRTITAPILELDMSTDIGEDIMVNQSFYRQQENNTLDYKVSGAEIYRVGPEGRRKYELISDKGYNHFVYPPSGAAYYAARVYAINALGEKVYSDFSNLLGVVRAPEISISEVVEGEAIINIENIDEYSKDEGIYFTIYRKDTTTNEDVEIKSVLYRDDQNGNIKIPVTENMTIYAKASAHDYEQPSVGLEQIYMYSRSSNEVNIVVEQ